MKFRLLSLVLGLALFTVLTANAEAQYMTQDVIFLKLGYIPVSNVTFDAKGSEDVELKGFAVQGEYNMNFNGFWLGFGLEYQYMMQEVDNLAGTKVDISHSFLMPEVSAKIATVGGLYVGGGVSGKYLIATEAVDQMEAVKKIDLWVNGILGYHMPIAEGFFLDLEGRFGWNLTNHQFSEVEFANSTFKTETKNAYDIGLYVGIGFRAPGSNY
jgi:hypothetical protein